jgi:hypothetical protein
VQIRKLRFSNPALRIAERCMPFKKLKPMIDNLYFIYCSILSFSGFAIGFYGIMAKHKIEMETRIGVDKGFEFDTDEGNSYFAERFENWKAGSSFDSQFAPIIGILIALTGAGLNLISNSWWSSILLLFVAYMIYLQVVKFAKWKIQIISMLTLLISAILIIIKLI